MPDHLGQVTRCESHVTTRLRYVHKSMVISGSPIGEEISVLSELHSVSVRSVHTNLNVPNGVLRTSDTESGVDLPQVAEKKYVKQGTSNYQRS